MKSQSFLKKLVYLVFLIAFPLAISFCVIRRESIPTISPTQPLPLETPVSPSPPEATQTPVAILGEPYPTDTSGFILGAGGSEEQMMEALRELAPFDVEAEIAMYQAEIARRGMNLEAFDFVPNILPGKSWVIVPRNKFTGRFWIPALTNPDDTYLIIASLHLFDYLDRPITEDFFDLIEVNITGTQQLVADKSSWHVIAGLNENGQVVSWYAANTAEVLPGPGLGLVETPSVAEGPPPYEVREGYKEKIRETILGVPVVIDLITDKSLQNREEKPIERLFLNYGFSYDPGRDVAKATMLAIYYAWRDDDPAREGVSFENYMGMVKEYTEGKRPLTDVEYSVWANSLLTADYDPQPFTFDPTKPIRVVYVHRYTLNNGKDTHNMSAIDIPGGNSYATHVSQAGNLEIWIHSSLVLGVAGPRNSWMASLQYVKGLNRLSWPSGYQTASQKVPLQYLDTEVYHNDVMWSMTMCHTDFDGSPPPPYVNGAINTEPNDSWGY